MTVRMRAPDRRRQVLKAALRCFARKGYRATTTAELAEAAAVTPPILYRHFEGKLDLFTAVLDEAAARTVGSWRAKLGGVADPRRRRAALVDAVCQARASDDQRVILRAMSEAEGDAAIADLAGRCLRRIRGFVAGEIEALQAAGLARTDAPAPELARRLISVAVGVAVTSPRGGRGPRAGSAGWIETLVAPPDKTRAGSPGRRGSPTSGR
jgi:AcrR family transcriptional regulator